MQVYVPDAFMKFFHPWGLFGIISFLHKQKQTQQNTKAQRNNQEKTNKPPIFSYFNMFQCAFVSTADHWNPKEATAVVNEQSDCPAN